MKKILALVLALAMVLGCTSAMAQINIKGWDVDSKGNLVNSVIAPDAAYKSESYVDKDGNLHLDIYGNIQDPNGILAAGTNYTVAVQEYVYNRGTKSYAWNNVAVGGGVTAGGANTPWALPSLIGPSTSFDGTNSAGVSNPVYVDNQETMYRVLVTVDNPKFPAESEKFYVNVVYGDSANGKPTYEWIVSGDNWYVDNHAHAFQNLSQTFDGGYKNGWKGTYANIKLTEGTQYIKLVAAGAWNIGNIIVTVKGDEVTFDYQMHEDIKTTDIWDEITVDKDYLNIFADEDSIDFWADSAFEFGCTYSIANDLGGDTEVALVAELIVDYNSSSPFVYREWTGMNP